MGKVVHIIFLLIISSSSMLLIANAQSLFQLGIEKKAKFRIYIQDFLGGPNATVYDVARANITSTSPTSFGLVRVGDSSITTGPDINSEKLGRAQGLITFTGLEEAALTFNLNLVFMAGKYNGSTLSVTGWRPPFDDNQELLIAGGTGVFRWSRGYTITNTYSYDPVTYHNILEFDIYVVYLEKESGFEFLANE